MSDREAFEVWYRKEHSLPIDFKFYRDQEGNYVIDDIHQSHQSWQSAVEHCKQGEPTFYAHNSTSEIVENIKGRRISEVTLKLTLQPQPEHGFTFPLFTHAMPKSEGKPVPVSINCPQCNHPHIDAGEWSTRPHKTHQCQHCMHEWRPFEYATVGVPTPQKGQV